MLLVPECATAAQLTLTWTDNAGNETGYRVERRTGSSGTYSEIAVLPVNTTTFTDTNVAGSTTYCYRVRAFNGVGNSGYSNEACRTTSISALSITVSKTGTGTGTVASTPAGINCGSDCSESYAGGAVVTLSATPGSGSRFDGWSGGGCAGTGSCTLTGNSSLTVSASFSSTSGAAGSTCTTGQYRAEYYNNTGLTGTPVFTRCESGIAYSWGTAGPGNGVASDNFSVRWTGRFDFASASHVFTARADDGIRMWVDGASVINAWKDQVATTYQATVPLTAGTHDVKVEYYERTGSAEARVSWAATGGSGGSGSGEAIVSGGSPIVRVTNPSGVGAGVSVIQDGDKPPAGSNDSRRQYDSWDGANSVTEDWVGYTFPSSHTFSRVVFQEGIHFWDGGWFTTLTVQVRQSGQWVNVSGLSITPAYAGNNGVSYETYTLTFNAIQGDGIRLYGAPGGSAAFISVGELEVYGSSTPTQVDVTDRAIAIVARVPASLGSGNSATVILDGDRPPVGSADPGRQYDSWDGANSATEDWVGYTFSTPYTFNRVVFQEGVHFWDGGWFTTLRVQVRQSGQWVNVSGLSITPAYAGNNGVSYETYTLTFNAIQGDGIRLDGAPGGSAAFISVGELRVISLVP